MLATEQFTNLEPSLNLFAMSKNGVCFEQVVGPDTSLSAEDAFTRQDLVASHLDLVRQVARRLRARLPLHIELNDLVAAGNLGLVDAASKFDVQRHVGFRTYAQFRIRGAMLDLLREMDWSPRALRREGRALDEAIRVLHVKGMQSPLEIEIADEMGMTLGAYQKLVQQLHELEVRSLDDDGGYSFYDQEINEVPGPDTDDPLFRCLAGQERERLVAAVDSLPERERVILSLYYYEELTMKQIAIVLSVSDSRISQLHCSALSHMRVVLGGLSDWDGSDRSEAIDIRSAND